MSIAIKIMPMVLQKIKYMVDKANGEISGLGKIKFVDGEIVVTSAVLCEQKNTGSSTDLSATDVAKTLFDLRNEEGDVAFWWHSHANMAVFWSGTDKDTIKELGSNGYLIASVFNKKGEVRTAYYQGNIPNAPVLFLDELKLETYSKDDPKIKEEWDKEYEAKVKTYKPKTQVGLFNDSDKYYSKQFKNWRKDKTGVIRFFTDKELEELKDELSTEYYSGPHGEVIEGKSLTHTNKNGETVGMGGNNNYLDSMQSDIPIGRRKEWTKRFKKAYNRNPIHWKEVEDYYYKVIDAMKPSIHTGGMQ